MKKKTYFFCVTLMLLVIIGGFTWKLNSLPDDGCSPSFDESCRQNAIAACADRGGSYEDHGGSYGVCWGYDCHGFYVIWCHSDSMGGFKEYSDCVEDNCQECYPDN